LSAALDRLGGYESHAEVARLGIAVADELVMDRAQLLGQLDGALLADGESDEESSERADAHAARSWSASKRSRRNSRSSQSGRTP
jgi:Arc/MetJ-type ribon-helix-helix transcriptional regulator